MLAIRLYLAAKGARRCSKVVVRMGRWACIHDFMEVETGRVRNAAEVSYKTRENVMKKLHRKTIQPIVPAHCRVDGCGVVGGEPQLFRQRGGGMGDPSGLLVTDME